MPRPKLQVDHFAIPVFDVERAFRFYSQTLGLKLVSAFDGDDWGGKPWLMMIFAAADGRQVALCSLRGVKRPPPDELPSDLRHFAFAASSSREYGAWKKRLAAAGVGFTEEDHGDQRSIYFPDPDGTIIEITTPAGVRANRTERGASAVVERWIRG
jgi:catechol 2,3-dioxygenase-like lactoylglutathione lyase family enzyme